MVDLLPPLNMSRWIDKINSSEILMPIEASERAIDELIQQRFEVAVVGPKVARNFYTLLDHLVLQLEVLKPQATLLCTLAILPVLAALMTIVEVLPQDLERVKVADEVPEARRLERYRSEDELLRLGNEQSEFLGGSKRFADGATRSPVPRPGIG